MTQAGNIQNNSINKAYSYAPSEPYSKGYSTDYSKNLGGNNDLAFYYENELLPYLHAIQSGEVQVSQEEYATLQQWDSYCKYELGAMSSGWGDTGAYPGAMGPGQAGPMQNQTITDGGEFTIDGSIPVTDVWGDSTMNVPPPCTVTFETTTDNTLTPSETIVKAIVTNPAMKGPDGQPLQSVVKFHDGGKITCNASKKGDGTSRAVDHTGTVTIGEYKAGAEEGGKPEASIDGEYDAETNTYTYDGTGQEVVKFWPQGSGEDGEITTHYAEASVDIYVKNTDRVYVYEKDGQWVTDVVHKDGSVDRIVQDKSTTSYTANINGVPEHIFFGADENHEGGSNPSLEEGKDEEPDQMKIPGGFGEHFTVNGEESVGSDGMIGLLTGIDATLIGNAVIQTDPSIEAAEEVLGDLYGVSNSMPQEEILQLIYNHYFKNDSNLVKYDADFDGTLSKEELAAAMKDGFQFPPATPDHKFLSFYSQVNKGLGQWLDELNDGYISDEKAADLRDFLVGSLQHIYDGKLHIEAGSESDKILIEGKEYDIINELGTGMFKQDPYENSTDILGL